MRRLTAACFVFWVLVFVACAVWSTPPVAAPPRPVLTDGDLRRRTEERRAAGLPVIEAEAETLLPLPAGLAARPPEARRLAEAEVAVRRARHVETVFAPPQPFQSQAVEHGPHQAAMYAAARQKRLDAEVVALAAKQAHRAKLKEESDRAAALARAEARRLVPQPDDDPQATPTADAIARARTRRAEVEERLIREAVEAVSVRYELPAD